MVYVYVDTCLRKIWMFWCGCFRVDLVMDADVAWCVEDVMIWVLCVHSR